MNSSKFAFLSKIPLCAWVLIIFAVAVGARFYWVAQKEDFHMDEISSLQFASAQSWTVPGLKEEKIYTAREVRQAAFGNAADNSDFGDDLLRLRNHNYDKCHTNFYYSLLRVVISGCEPEFHPLLFRGFALNLFLFAGSFAIWTALFKKLFRGNDFAVCVALAAASLNAGAIAMTAFVHEYELQMFWVSAFALAFVMLVEAWTKDSSRATWKSLLASWPKLLALAVVTAGALLSGYFSIVFVILATIALCAVAAKSRGAKAILFPPAALVLAFGIASIIYPDYFNGFASGRGTEAAGKFNPAIILENIGNTWNGAVGILKKIFPGKACGMALILFLAVLVGKKIFEIDAARKRSRDVPVPAAAADVPELPQERTGAKARIFVTFDAFLASPTAMLLVAAFLATCAILYLAPIKTSRYVVAFYPILALVFPLVVAKLRSRGIACVAGVAFIALFVVFAFSATKNWPSRVSLRPLIEYLVNDSSKWRSLMRKYAGLNSAIIFRENNILLGFSSVMDIPADANVVFLRRDKASSTVTVKTFGKKSVLFLGGKSGKSDVALPRGTVGKEIRLNSFAMAIPLTFDESKPAHILKWRARRGKVAKSQPFYDVVEVPEPAKNAPADAKK